MISRPDFSMNSGSNPGHMLLAGGLGSMLAQNAQVNDNSHYQHQRQPEPQPQPQQHNAPTDDPYSTQVPLFARRNKNSFLEEEREDRLLREDTRLLREQLEETHKQLAQVEHINEDLEHRLEHQARRHLKSIRSNENKFQTMLKERDAAMLQVKRWKNEHEAQVRRTEVGAERLRRVEKELYRMHLRKYNLLNAGGETKLNSGKAPDSPFPPGFPVPQDVATFTQYTAMDGTDLEKNDSNKVATITNKSRIKDEERRAMSRMRKSNMPCYVHGRVGCPCSAMAYETNVSEGLDSLACFLGLPMSDTSDQHDRGYGTGQYRGSESNITHRKKSNVSMDYRTPDLRPSGFPGESPSGLSLPGMV